MPELANVASGANNDLQLRSDATKMPLSGSAVLVQTQCSTKAVTVALRVTYSVMSFSAKILVDVEQPASELFPTVQPKPVKL